MSDKPVPKAEERGQWRSYRRALAEDWSGVDLPRVPIVMLSPTLALLIVAVPLGAALPAAAVTRSRTDLAHRTGGLSGCGRMGAMEMPNSERSPESPQILVVGPDGMALTGGSMGNAGEGEEGRETPVTEMVEQPAKVMRIGSMIKQLLEEVRAAPLDEASRVRLKEIHASSVKELEQGLAPELVEELERLSLPFTEESVPSEAELRIAQAQLVGWLEGLFHGIQTALFAQQMAARAQLEQMRRALPPGALGRPEDDDEGGQPGIRSGPYL